MSLSSILYFENHLFFSLKLNFCFDKNIEIHPKPSYTKLDWEDQMEQSA